MNLQNKYFKPKGKRRLIHVLRYAQNVPELSWKYKGCGKNTLKSRTEFSFLPVKFGELKVLVDERQNSPPIPVCFCRMGLLFGSHAIKIISDQNMGESSLTENYSDSNIHEFIYLGTNTTFT